MNDLKQIQLGDYAKVLSGYAFKSGDFIGEGVPVIKIANIKNGAVVLEAGNTEYLPKDFVRTTHPRFHIKRGDILVSLTGSHMTQPNSVVGRVAQYKLGSLSLLNQRAGKVDIFNKTELDNNFLYYLLSTNAVRQEIAMMAYGAASQANVSGKDIERLKLNVPSKTEQTKIAAILSAYDELIENNARRIALLEKMAEEIYREWFVRFRFPDYQNTEFIKGVPQGWEVTASDKVFRVMSGGTPKTEVAAFWDGEIPFFTPRDTTDNFYALTTGRSITLKGLDACHSPLYPKDTIFITARGTVGKLCMAFREMAMNQTCYALAPVEAGPICFHFLSMKNAIAHIKGVSKSGVFDNIVVDTFRITPILMPPAPMVAQFNEVALPIFEQVGYLLEQNEKLAATRDLLLPRLLSGKLDVSALAIAFPPALDNAVSDVAGVGFELRVEGA